MPTQCSRDLFGSEMVERRQVVAAFDFGENAAEAGGLLGAIDRAVGRNPRSGVTSLTGSKIDARTRYGADVVGDLAPLRSTESWPSIVARPPGSSGPSPRTTSNRPGRRDPRVFGKPE